MLISRASTASSKVMQMRELHMRKMPLRQPPPNCWFRAWLKEERRTWGLILLAALVLLIIDNAFWG